MSRPLAAKDDGACPSICPDPWAGSFPVQFLADAVDRLGDMPFDGPNADVEPLGE